MDYKRQLLLVNKKIKSIITEIDGESKSIKPIKMLAIGQEDDDIELIA